MSQTKIPILLRRKSIIIFLCLTLVVTIACIYLLYQAFGLDINKSSIPTWAKNKVMLYGTLSTSIYFMPSLFLCWALLTYRIYNHFNPQKFFKWKSILTFGLLLGIVGYHTSFIAPKVNSKFKTLIYDMQRAFPYGDEFEQSDMTEYFSNSPSNLSLFELYSYHDSIQNNVLKEENKLAGYVKSNVTEENLDVLLKQVDFSGTSLNKETIENHPNKWANKGLPHTTLEQVIFSKIQIIELKKETLNSVNRIIWEQFSIPISSLLLFIIGACIGSLLNRIHFGWYILIVFIGILPIWTIIYNIVRRSYLVNDMSYTYMYLFLYVLLIGLALLFLKILVKREDLHTQRINKNIIN